MSHAGPLLIVGASGRAAAASAIRAGYDPFVLDLFADEDTKRLCPVWKCQYDDYPHGFLELQQRLPPMPWLYTGGLENDPDIVAEISRKRPLIGNRSDVLHRVRNPFVLHELLSINGIKHPWINHPAGETWPRGPLLRKPCRGSAGIGIRFATERDVREANEKRDEYYLQEFVIGMPMSAQFQSADSGVRSLGVLRQLIGEAFLHAPDFRYCGNIGPISSSVHGDILPHADRLARIGGLTSVWGLDFMAVDHTPYLLEVNPRYTAAMELIEWAFGSAVLRDWQTPPSPRTMLGKVIYYAPHAFSFPADGPWLDSLARCTEIWQRPDYADIPAPGSCHKAGQPVLTIIAEGLTEASVREQLKAKAAELDKLFAWTPSSA